MTAITLHLDPATEARLRQAADELDCSVEEFAVTSIAAAAFDHFRDAPTADPGRIQFLVGCAGASLNDRRPEVLL